MGTILQIALLALAASTPVSPHPTERVLITQTGAQIQCEELESVRFKDLPWLFGVTNSSREYVSYRRFRMFAPRDCTRAPRIGHSGRAVYVAY